MYTHTLSVYQIFCGFYYNFSVHRGIHRGRVSKKVWKCCVLHYYIQCNHRGQLIYCDGHFQWSIQKMKMVHKSHRLCVVYAPLTKIIILEKWRIWAMIHRRKKKKKTLFHLVINYIFIAAAHQKSIPDMYTT